MKRASILIVVLLVGLAAGQEPPPFGTELQEWSLQMSGAYAGSGMTWRRDEGRFYLMDQGYAGQFRVWKLDPADPPATIESVPWTFANLGATTTDIPWCIAWDSDSACFWISQLPDGNIYGGCYLMRHVWNGSRWVWGGTPSDSWCITDDTGQTRVLWFAGMEKWHERGYFVGTTVASRPDTGDIRCFEPYTKTVVRRIVCGDYGYRGLTLVPWDSCYILACGWSTGEYHKLDSLGSLIQSAPATYGPADWALHVPSVIRPEDTVCAYCINTDPVNHFVRVSVGMLWGQLGSVGVREEQPSTGSRRQAATVARGVLIYQQTANSSQPAAELLDINGRHIMFLQHGPNDVRHIAPGVYFVRSAESGKRSAVRKVVIQR